MKSSKRPSPSQSQAWQVVVRLSLCAHLILQPATTWSVSAQQSPTVRNPFSIFTWFNHVLDKKTATSEEINGIQSLPSSEVYFKPEDSYGETFKIIWNVPSFQCHKYGLNFSKVSEWGITQNYGDEFRGDQIALLYDPGLFPALLEATVDSDLVRRNGGVPQEANLTDHLNLLADQIQNKLILDPDFSGLAIIDFEHWRPIFHENFGSLLPYKKMSRTIEQSLHPFWTSSEIEKEAARRFEKAGWQFFRRTLRLAKELRPKALWGYYGFPLCFNYTPRNNQPRCSTSVRENNERLKWLFEESTALYPSLYYKKDGMSEEKRALFMKGRMTETVRVSRMSRSPSPIYPYTWIKYYDTKELVNKDDLINSLAIPRREGATGVIIWGASNDVNTERKCRALDSYVQSVLGPIAKKVIQTPSEEVHTLISALPEKPSIPLLTDIIDNTIAGVRRLNHRIIF